MSKKKKNKIKRNRDKLCVVNPCNRCDEIDCATCRFNWLADKNVSLKHTGDDEDAYLFVVDFAVSLGPLCLACLTRQMETRKEVISSCSDEECPWHFANTLHITEVRLSTEPSFDVEIVKSEYRLPTSDALVKGLLQRSKGGCQTSLATA